MLSARQSELGVARERVRELEGQLKAAHRHADKAATIKMKKVNIQITVLY